MLLAVTSVVHDDSYDTRFIASKYFKLIEESGMRHDLISRKPTSYDEPKRCRLLIII